MTMSRASNPLPDTIYAIQHLAFEDLGHWEDIFYQLGFRVRYFEAGVEDLTQALTYAGLTNLSSMKYFSFLASFGKLAYLDLSNKPL